MTAADELLLDTPATRPCNHKRHHDHGTVQRYRQDRCRCLACRKANTSYEQGRRAHVAAYGRWTAFADARPVRVHVLDLMQAGLRRADIARLADLSSDTLRRLLDSAPPVQRVRRQTATALLGLGTGRQRPANQAGLWDGGSR